MRSGIRVGAPGSFARWSQEQAEAVASSPNRWLVAEWTPGAGRSPILRAAQPTRDGALSYMAPGRYLISVESGGTFEPYTPPSTRCGACDGTGYFTEYGERYPCGVCNPAP